MKPDLSKFDADKMVRAQSEANAAVVEIASLQNAGKGGRALREAVRAREANTRKMMQALTGPRNGVLTQMEKHHNG